MRVPQKIGRLSDLPDPQRSVLDGLGSCHESLPHLQWLKWGWSSGSMLELTRNSHKNVVDLGRYSCVTDLTMPLVWTPHDPGRDFNIARHVPALNLVHMLNLPGNGDPFMAVQMSHVLFGQMGLFTNVKRLPMWSPYCPIIMKVSLCICLAIWSRTLSLITIGWCGGSLNNPANLKQPLLLHPNCWWYSLYFFLPQHWPTNYTANSPYPVFAQWLSC